LSEFGQKKTNMIEKRSALCWALFSYPGVGKPSLYLRVKVAAFSISRKAAWTLGGSNLKRGDERL